MIEQPPVFEACIWADSFCDNWYFDEVEKRIIVAEVNFHCCECGARIKPGQEYEFIRGLSMWQDEDTWGDEWKERHKFFHTCLPCSRILEDDSLFPQGRIYGGGLWELLAEQGFYPERTM